MAREISQQSLEYAYRSVERDALQHSERQERPYAIVLGGQPGSGKSVLSSQAEQDLQHRGGAVVIDADRMREEHPRYQQLSKEDPLNAADRTHKEAGAWAQRLTVTAIEERRNLVVDGTMRNPEAILQLASHLKEQGYTVEARVMAVDAETSMTRARLRFEESVEQRGTGRFVNREQHDNAYDGIPKSIQALEEAKLADSVKLYNGNHKVIFENKLDGGTWDRAESARSMLEHERSCDWTHSQRADYVTTLEKVYELAKTREGSVDRVSYQLGSAGANDVTTYRNVYGAAAAFREAKSEDAPYVRRTQVNSAGQETAVVVAHTVSVDFRDETRHAKTVSNTDELFKRAYENGGQQRTGSADLEILAAKLEHARRDLDRFEQSDTFLRAQAFDKLPMREALIRYPELDGAFKRLQDIESTLPTQGTLRKETPPLQP